MAKNLQPLTIREQYRLFSRLFSEHVHKRRRAFAIATFWIVASSLSLGAVAWLTRSVVNNVFINNEPKAMATISVAIAGVFFIRGITEYNSAVHLARIGASIRAERHMEMIKAILHSRMKVLRAESAAKHSAKINRLSLAASSAVMLICTNLFSNLLTLLVLTGVMIYQQPFLSLTALVVSPLAILLLRRLSAKIGSIGKDEAALDGAVIGLAAEAIGGVVIVKSFQIEDKVTADIEKAVRKREARSNTVKRLIAASGPIMETLGGLVIVAAIVMTGRNIASGDQTPGAIASFIVAFMLAYAPAKKLATFNQRLTRLARHIETMYRMMETAVSEEEVRLQSNDRLEPNRERVEHAIPLGEVSTITFKDVSYSYTAGHIALSTVSFSVKKGENIAIVGRSGSGKTTIANLLLGFENNFEGNITINDLDIREIPVSFLRQTISLVTQDTFLFEGTIKNNVTLGKPEATVEEIEVAVRMAGVDDFTKSLPNGLDTKLSPNGGNLSGGQRQRITIARALLKSAPIVIWDEATSALDVETQTYINESCLKAFSGRIQLIISHRQQSAELADKVLFLEHGKVIGFGNHQLLMEEIPAYSRLWGEIEHE